MENVTTRTTKKNERICDIDVHAYSGNILYTNTFYTSIEVTEV